MAIVDITSTSLAYDADVPFTINVGTNAGAEVSVFGEAGSGLTFTGATIDGTLISALQTGSDAAGKNFGLAARLVSGTGTISGTAHFSAVGSTKYVSVVARDGIASIRNTDKNSGATNASPSIAMVTVAGDIVDMLGSDSLYGTTFSATSPAVVLTDGTDTFSSGTLFGAQKTAAGTSTTVAGSLTASAPWGVVGITLVPTSTVTPIAFTGTVPNQSGTVGGAFSLSLASYFSGNQTPFAYSVFSGTLPAGLSLNTSTGVISGTPTAAVVASGIVIRGTDTASNVANTNSFTITITTVPSITTSPLKNNTGTLIASTSIPKVGIYKLSDMTLALALTSQTTNSSGVLFLQNAALVATTDYLVVLSDATGASVGVGKYTAAP